MRTISIKLNDMAIANIQLGFVGEDNATQVIFESESIFNDHPDAVQLLVVTPPEGTTYEVTTARVGNNVVWNVSDLDTAFKGEGSLQLTFTDDSHVIKTYNAATTILESQVPSGTAPDSVLNWIEDAEAWAKGTRGGRAVEDDDPTYQNNSKYYSDKIVNMASDSEAWAKGTRDGEAVESDDPAYHNNSKYYAESIADTASDSEAYAAGTRGGEAVDEDDPAYHNNAAYYNDQAALEKAAAQAAAETASAAYNVNLLAANYDATKTYAVGEYVIYSGGLYRCISAITTAEAWTSGHWTSVTVGKDTSDLKSAFDKLYNGEVVKIGLETSNTYPLGYRSGTYNSSTGKSSSSGTSNIRAISAIPIVAGDKVKVSPSEGHTVKVVVFSSDTPNVGNNADNPSFLRTLTGDEIVFTAVSGEYYFICTNVPYDSMTALNIPTVAYYSGLLEEVEGIGNDAEMLENRVDNFICSRTLDTWTYGTINVSNGVVAEKTTPQPYIHTAIAEGAGITEIAIESGYAFMFAAYAKSDGTYIGVWGTNSFAKSATWQTGTLIVENIPNIKTYNVIVIVKKSDDSTLSLPTDATRTTFSYRTDTTFTVPGVAADSVAVGNMRSLSGKTIVSMGDSIFGKYSAPSDISSYLSRLSGATCYNCAFGGTRAVVRTGAVDTKYFDFGSLVSAILANDFTTQEAKAEAIDETYPERLATLESVDWNTVDILTINYGTNDYNAGYAIADFKAALIDGIEALMTAYPNLRVALCSPIFRVMGESGSRVPADEYEISGQTLTDFVTAVKEVSVQEHTQFINNYYLGVNMLNWQYYYNDTTHPKATCRRMIATNIWNNLA